MGTYYVFYCLEKKEWIDPGEVNGGPIKMPDCAYASGLGRLLVFLMDLGWQRGTGDGSWRSMRVVGDSWPHDAGKDPLPSHEEITQNEWAETKNEWKNVTAQAIEAYNTELKESEWYSKLHAPLLLNYTPDPHAQQNEEGD